MSTSYDATLVLAVNSSHMNEALADEFDTDSITEEQYIEIAQKLGDRWVSNGTYQWVNEEIVKVARDILPDEED